MRDVDERFDSYVETRPPSDCLWWTGGAAHGGYGQFSIKGQGCGAHRYSYERHYGPFDKSLCVLHKCDNPGCVNPKHLFLGTVQDNMDDKIKKGRQPRGATHSRAKLSEENVLDIRRLGAEGVMGLELSDRFKVSSSAIYAILTRRAWAHL